MKKKRASEASKRKRKPVRRWGNQFSKAYTDAEIEAIADQLVEWFKDARNVWLKDFATEQMLGSQRISEFASKNEYFAFCYNIAKDMQESRLVRLGMSKQVSASMPIFALKNVAGWRDVQDMNLTASVKVIRDTI
jgi:hypothetical protein